MGAVAIVGETGSLDASAADWIEALLLSIGLKRFC